MFKYKNGWDLAKMMAAIKARNNGTRCEVETGDWWNSSPRYRHPEIDNCCVVGCFISNEDYAEEFEDKCVLALPIEIRQKFPLHENAMSNLQSFHDVWARPNHIYEDIEEWLKTNVRGYER